MLFWVLMLAVFDFIDMNSTYAIHRCLCFCKSVEEFESLLLLWTVVLLSELFVNWYSLFQAGQS